ncbi:MAG: hypothetical protein WA918_10670 [Erythrobacter sp.]
MLIERITTLIATACHAPRELEFKSALHETPARPDRKGRYRPRRTTSDRLREALSSLARNQGQFLTHEEAPWSSITFSGTRHEITLAFEGAEAVAAGETFIAALPEHEFTVPGQLVADADVREVEHRFAAEERLVVTCVLLLLEEV